MRGPTEFQRAVHKTVRTIPEGKVTTYAAVASKSGYPGAAQSVGNALRVGYDGRSLPWWRVVRSDRKLPKIKDPDEQRLNRRHRMAYWEREGIELDERDRVPEGYFCDW